jgi:hypothetical protein
MTPAQERTTGGGERPEGAGLGAVAGALRGLRRRARVLLFARGGGLLLAAAVAAGLGVGLIDYVVRMPGGLRTVILLAAVAALVEGVRRVLVPAWRFRPGLTEVALRLERSEEGKKAGLDGRLASALELGSAADERPVARYLTGRLTDETVRRFRGVRASAILTPAPTGRNLGLLALVLVTVGVLWGVRPELARIGAQRVLTPWADVSWPKRTEVVDATGVRVHALGTALPLRAALTRSDRGEARVAARYRVIVDGQAGPVRRALLTEQRRQVEVQTERGQVKRGELFERLIEPAALAPGGRAGDGDEPVQRVELEYWFETSDDSTRAARVLLADPPSVRSASAEVSPPDYAGTAIAAGSPIVSGRLDLGPGTDARAVVGPVLAGSELDLEIRFNKPLPMPGADAEAFAGPVDDVELARRDWARYVLGDEALAGHVVAWEEGPTARVALRMRLEETARIPVQLIDEHGLRSVEQSVYSFEVVQDQRPTAVVIDPPEDESVLATAVVDVTGEARDDAGLVWVALERQRARPPSGSIGAAAEAIDERVSAQRRETAPGPGEPALLEARVSARLDLSVLDLLAGDELWLTALAQDTFSIDGRTREPTRSSVRRLRIISEQELIDQVRASLAGVRESAMRLDEEQRDLSRAVQERGADPENRSRQSGLTERLGAQRETVERLADRVARNALDDRQLEALLGEAERALERASEASLEAARNLNVRPAPDPSLDEQEREDVQRAQQRVRDELGRLIEALDRGEDSWLARRNLERLLEEQRRLAERTAEAGEQTLGRDAESLTAQERAMLESLAQRQRELARQARESLDELQERAEALQNSDPAQAAAMEQAAERGRRAQVPEKLDDASGDIEQNRPQAAGQQQQEAIEALEQMLDELDNAQRNRDEALRRLLASVIESIRSLVMDQERELEVLARAEAAGSLSGLDAGMIRLHQNTLALAGDLRGSFPELIPVAGMLGDAAGEQSEAVVRLRAASPDAGRVRSHEQRSLEHLQRALAEAERLRDEARQREQDRKRAELRRAYREMLEQQVALRGETEPFVGRELTRRQVAQVRGLGRRQQDLVDDLETLASRTEELAEAGVFALAHRRLGDAAGSAAKVLSGGRADGRAVRSQRTAIRILQSLIDALDESQREQEFREEAGGEGEGGGAGAGETPLIPPIAELKLLRAMQREAADLTRALDEAPDAQPEEVEQVGRLQRELADQGQELLERVMSPPGGGAGPEVREPEGPQP